MMIKDGERGATLAEYVLLLGLIAMLALIALRNMGQSVSNKFSEFGATIALQ